MIYTRLLKTKGLYFILILSFLLFIQNCNKQPFYQAEADIPNGSWHMDTAISFKPDIIDTAQRFDLFLSISHKNDYRYRNVWFFIKSKSPVGYSHVDTINIQLAENNGKWYGKKTGDLYVRNMMFKKQIAFPRQGEYTFEIVQGMRDIELKEIYKLGFTIQESQNN